MTNKVMKITAADFERVVGDVVNQRMMIAGAGGSPGQPYTPPKEDPNNPYVPAPKRDKLAKGPQLPNFKPMGREIKGVRKGVLSPEENKIRQQLQIGPQANVNYGAPTERDKWLQLFQGKGGSLRNIEDPDLRKLILQRGAMKADASNNIRSLQSSGHQTVLDDERSKDGRSYLKIIKQFRPPKA